MIWGHLAMGLCQLVLVGLILRRGSIWDQLAAGTFLAVAWGGLIASFLQLSNILQIAFWMAVILFVVMWFCAEKARRWWMIGMAGFQLMSLMTYLAPVNQWDRLRAAFVLFHWMLGLLCFGCLILALFEIAWQRQHVRQLLGARASDGPDLDLGHRP